jgi:hypothetical protein
MLDFGCRREMPPARRQIGDTRHVGEGDKLVGDRKVIRALRMRFIGSLPWRYVAVPGAEASGTSRVRDDLATVGVSERVRLSV